MARPDAQPTPSQQRMQRPSAFIARALAVALALLAPTAALAQGRVIPDPIYFQTLAELFEGEYQRAERGLRNELRSAVRVGETRWIDSICYHTMLGEALYQQGRHAEALEQLDRAIELLLANRGWMRRVNFQQGPRIDNNLARRLPNWARTERAATYADMPRTFLVSVGRLDNSQQAQQGGVIQLAQFWKLDAQEIARSAAWAIYRRGRILGPLARHDALHKRLSDRLSGGGFAPRGHWSGAWAELWLGLAQMADDPVVARPHLQKATKLSGQLDHALGALAQLALGESALLSGDLAAADPALREAIRLAIAYEDLGALDESMRLAHAAATTGELTPPPLEGIDAWASRLGWRHVAIDARLALAERALMNGDAAPAKAASQLFRRTRDAGAGLLGLEAARLNALASTLDDSREINNLIRQAIEAQRSKSLRRFRVALAVNWVRRNELSPRLAAGVLPRLLGDPSPADWAAEPLDTLASLSDAQTEPLDLWFSIALTRRDPITLLRAIDLERRRRFFASRPLAGRGDAIRWLLESDKDALPPGPLAARDRLHGRLKGYGATRGEIDGVTAALRAADPLGNASSEAKRLDARLGDLTDQQERRVARAALGRLATPLGFPPALDPVAARAALEPGEALLAFHDLDGQLHGVLFVAEGEHAWRIGKTDKVGAEIERLLAAAAGVSPQQTWNAEQLSDAAWRETATELGELLLGGSRLDYARVKRLTIVPDGPLWRLPFELLVVGPQDEAKKSLLEIAPVRFAPTPGWAFRNRTPPSADGPRTGLIAAAREDGGEGTLTDPVIGSAGAKRAAVPLRVGIPTIKAVADRLVVDTPQSISRTRPYDLELSPGGRRGAGSLAAWSRLPRGATRVVVLSRLTGGEAGGKPGRRSRGVGRRGDEAFHAVCGLLAGGVETALLARWSTDGQRSRDLVAELLIGLGDRPADEAWRRSVSLARATPLDAAHEPRFEPTDAGAAPPTGEHPFWWAGWLLVD